MQLKPHFAHNDVTRWDTLASMVTDADLRPLLLCVRFLVKRVAPAFNNGLPSNTKDPSQSGVSGNTTLNRFVAQ